MAGEKILIVEDEGIAALDLEQTLVRLGYEAVGVAGTGKEALALATEVMPDLVLMDIRLHGEMDGITTAGALQVRFGLPVVYVTAYADQETLERAKISEPYGYIVKPFEERELRIAIDLGLYKHRMERRLRESERWLATTLRSIGDAVIATDNTGRITFMNPVAANLTGWKPDEARGRSLDEVFRIINRDTRRPVANPVVRVLREGRVVGLANHTNLIARSGFEVPVDDSAAPIRDDKGDILGVVLVFRDVTEREEAEKERERLLAKELELGEELAALNEELQAQNEELQFAQEETARLLKKQSTLFMSLQEALLDIPEELPGIKFGHLYRSATQEARIGGDFYDVFQAKNDHIGLLIGDVCGHGVEAARIASLVKDTVHAFAHQFRRPYIVLRETNRLLLEKKAASFVTAFLGILDPVNGNLLYCSAGHPAPLMASGDHIKSIEAFGPPLGIFPDASYKDCHANLPQDCVLLLYTDGMTEARKDGDLFGEVRLGEALGRRCMGGVESLPGLLLEETLRFCGGRLTDDVALLAVRYLGRTVTE